MTKIVKTDKYFDAHSGGRIIFRLKSDKKTRQALCGRCEKPLKYLGEFIVGIAKTRHRYQCTGLACEWKYETRREINQSVCSDGLRITTEQETIRARKEMKIKNDFNGGAIDCPHCGRISTLRKNEAGILYLEKIISTKKCPDCKGLGWTQRWRIPIITYKFPKFTKCSRCKGTGVIRE